MFVTNLISIRVFVIIYRCFIRNYVMIFFCVVMLGLKNVNLGNLSL